MALPHITHSSGNLVKVRAQEKNATNVVKKDTSKGTARKRVAKRETSSTVGVAAPRTESLETLLNIKSITAHSIKIELIETVLPGHAIL